jgi:hypothetical protein
MELFDEINELKRQDRNLPGNNDRYLPANEPSYAAGAGKPAMHGSGKEDDAAAEKREYEADPGRPATNRAPVQPKSSSEYVRGEKLLTDMRTSKYADPDSDDAKHASWKSYYTSMDTLHKKMKGDTVEENKQLFTRMSELIFEYLKSLRSNRASA